MISVQNLLPPLSGSKIFIGFLIWTTILSSCSTSKKVLRSSPDIKHIETSHEIPKQKPLPDKIDTMVWRELPSKSKEPHIVIEEKKAKEFKPLSQIKLTVLIPFKSDEVDTSAGNIPVANLRFVHYYSGMKMALNEFNSTANIPIQLDVFDVADNDQTKEILLKEQNGLPQIVIGPYKNDAVKYAAEWAKKNETFVISPWISSSSIADNNPFYFQAKAGLNAHYQLINEHVRSHFSNEKILLISKSKEDSKLKLFNSLASDPREIKEEIISEEDLATRPEPVLDKFIKLDDTTVFILPLASLKDENYIYQFLRHVISEKNGNIVYVYGLYKWLEMKSEILEYINNLNVRISISNFVDGERPVVKTFKRSYFDAFREFPSEDAMEGYDLTKYLISSLKKYGKQFYLNTEEAGNDYLETKFLFKPVYKSNHESTNEIDYYENKFIKLIEIKENKYKSID